MQANDQRQKQILRVLTINPWHSHLALPMLLKPPLQVYGQLRTLRRWTDQTAEKRRGYWFQGQPHQNWVFGGLRLCFRQGYHGRIALKAGPNSRGGNHSYNSLAEHCEADSKNIRRQFAKKWRYSARKIPKFEDFEEPGQKHRWANSHPLHWLFGNGL